MKKLWNMIKNLIFDFGGVIADISRESAVNSFRSLGLAEADEMLDSYKQNGIFLELESGRISADDFRQKLGVLCGRELTMHEVGKAWLGFFCGETDTARLEFLESLRGRYRMLLLSNTNYFVMEWARSPRFSSLGQPLDHYMDHLYLSYEMKCVKPDREIFSRMIEHSGIVPGESLFIDDGPANAEAARQMGLEAFCPSCASEWMDYIRSL